MAVHRIITETHEPVGHKCDLCATGYPAWIYRTETAKTRGVRDTGIIVDHWYESKWSVCHVCALLVQNRERQRLLQRMSVGRDDVPVTRRNILTIAAFLEHLLPGRERIGGTHDSVSVTD